jgi:hypothetical protein
MSHDDLGYIIAPKDDWYCAGRMGNTVSEEVTGSLIVMRTDSNHVRVLFKHPLDGVIAGIHYKAFEDIFLVIGMHTRTNFRRNGVMTKLIDMVADIDGILTIDGNRTVDGDKLVAYLKSLPPEEAPRVLLEDHAIY